MLLLTSRRKGVDVHRDKIPTNDVEEKERNERQIAFVIQLASSFLFDSIRKKKVKNEKWLLINEVKVRRTKGRRKETLTAFIDSLVLHELSSLDTFQMI